MEAINEKYLTDLKEIQELNISVEERHYLEDNLLCRLLNELGFKEIVNLYNSTAKYYS